MRKRLKDCPTSGGVSVVITDIENFTGEMEANEGPDIGDLDGDSEGCWGGDIFK